MKRIRFIDIRNHFTTWFDKNETKILPVSLSEFIFRFVHHRGTFENLAFFHFD